MRLCLLFLFQLNTLYSLESRNDQGKIIDILMESKGYQKLNLHLAEYVLGEVNTNICPSGSVKITDKSTCQTASSTFVNGRFLAEGSFPDFPTGCMIGAVNGDTYFNTHAGSAHSGTKPLCVKGN